MSQHIRLWKVGERDRLQEIQSERLDLERRLEQWIEHDISMIADGLLVIGKQVPTTFGGFLDLLCLDANGDLVIVELKRDRTPREVTAQVLEYASWAVNLSNDRIVEIADAYLGEKGPLEKAFRDAFGSDLPDTLNEGHQMLIVASEIDSSSERIIRYLSDVHGVRINAVTFQFFRDAGEEYLARAFLLEPTDVDYKAQSKAEAEADLHPAREDRGRARCGRTVPARRRRAATAF